MYVVSNMTLQLGPIVPACRADEQAEEEMVTVVTGWRYGGPTAGRSRPGKRGSEKSGRERRAARWSLPGRSASARR